MVRILVLNFEVVIFGENGHMVTTADFSPLLMQYQEIHDHVLVPCKMRYHTDAL
jgi:hypothetical protein